jgi:hypothetical protein
LTAPKILNLGLWFRFFGHGIRKADAWLFGIEYQQYHRVLRRLVLDEDCDSLLDVGCGENSPIGKFGSEIRYRVGVDTHPPSIERSRSAGIHSDYVVASVLDIGSRFAPRSFDCVTLLEVIEHLPHEDGGKLLDQCERIARRKVVVSTPNGFLFQAATPDNPFQEHVSGWTVDDFVSRGYEVTGIAGWKPLRGPLMRPSWRPHAIFRRLSLVTEPWFESRPRQAFQLLCVKKISGA